MFPNLKSVGVGCLACVLCCNWYAGALDIDPVENQVTPVRPTIAILPARLADEFASRMKETIVKQLPPELVYESRHNWGHQAEIPSVQGLRPIRVMRNHGDWEKARVVAGNLGQHLALHIGELYSPTENRVTFTIHLSTPAVVELRSQTWQNGLQVFTSSARARFRLAADFTMEAALTPTATLHCTGASFSTRAFVAENINGLGGDFARLSSDRAKQSFKPWQPTILTKFQKSMLAALNGAGQSSDLSVNLAKMMQQSMTSRVTVLQAQTAAGRYVPVAPLPTPEVVAVPSVYGSVWIELPIQIRGPARVNRLSSAFAHWGLVEHSIHVAHGVLNAPTSEASHHAAPAHKK